jgi:hypothetical protein
MDYGVLLYEAMVSEFNKGCQPRSNLIKDENGVLIADFHNILNKLKNYISLLLNVHRVSNVWQREIYTQLSR